jgi:hypothetical protein
VNLSDLDDIARAVGYRAARVIALHYAGRRLHVPATARPDHPLSVLIGRDAFVLLVREFAACRLLVPCDTEEQRFTRDWRIAALLADGRSAEQIAAALGMSSRRVEQIRVRLARDGWLTFEGAPPGRGRGRRVAVRPEILGTGEVSDGPPGGTWPGVPCAA